MASKLLTMVSVLTLLGMFPQTSERPQGIESHRSQNNSTKRRSSPTPPVYNVVYIIDSSSSISNINFKCAIKAIELMTSKAQTNTKYAAVMFATHARVISTFTTPDEIIRRVKAVKRIKGATNKYAALKVCSEKLLNNPSSGINPKALNRVLVITDGLSNMKQSKTFYQALRLKMNNTEIYVVAVGHYLYGADEISTLASSQESHVFRVNIANGQLSVIKWIPYNRFEEP